MGNFKWNYTGGPIAPGRFETKYEASGTFSVTVDLSNHEGVGKGQGNVHAATSGTCTGMDSVDYTFTLTASLSPVSNNLTVLFSTSQPAGSSFQLSCDKSEIVTSDTATYDIYSVYPMFITLPGVAGTTAEGIAGGISYEIDLL